MVYRPVKEILRQYALVLVDFSLGGGEGIKEKEVAYLQFDLPALPLALEVYRRLLEKKAYPLLKINEEKFLKIFYQIARDDQLEFLPKKYSKALVATIDHRISLIANRQPLLLKKIAPEKITRANKPAWLLKKWFGQKEDEGKFSWTIALYGTGGMANEAGLTVKDYWRQIIRACFLDEKNPIRKWQLVFRELEQIKKKLNSLSIDKIHLVAQNTDLWISLGEKRRFVGGSGRNIPSFEIFTSPDWRGVEGKIYFDFPLYRYGNLIQGIFLQFKNGRVTKANAKKNEKLLRQLIKQKNADRVGEFSLTDKRFSRISQFMAHTLYDENFGGSFGNVHLALGSSYHDCYSGEAKKLKDQDFERLGFNHSAEHCDLIAISNRLVEAVLRDGTKKIIYKNGKFVI